MFLILSITKPRDQCRWTWGRNMFPHVSGSLSSLPASAMSSSTCTCTSAHSAQSASRRTSSFRNLTFLFRDPILPYFKKLLESFGGVRELASLKIFQDTHRGLRGFTHQVKGIYAPGFAGQLRVLQESLCPIYCVLPPISPNAVFPSCFSKCNFFKFFLFLHASAAAADADAFAEEADAKRKEVLLRISIPYTHLLVHTHTQSSTHTHTIRIPYTHLFVHTHTHNPHHLLLRLGCRLIIFLLRRGTTPKTAPCMEP